MKTIRGIYTNTEESSYKFKFKNYTFYFSSMFYLNKFKKNVENYIRMQQDLMFYKYRVNFDSHIEIINFALSYYQQIEKRGYKVIDNEGNNLYS